jgi:hypothetical protein
MNQDIYMISKEIITMRGATRRKRGKRKPLTCRIVS